MIGIGAALVVVAVAAVVRPRAAARRTRPAAPGGRVRAAWLLGAATVVVAATAGPLVGAALAIGAWVVRRRRALRATGAAGRTAMQQYPDAIDLVVLAIRAGHLPGAAVASVQTRLPDAMRAPFGAVVERVRAGERFADALGALEDGLGPMVRPLVDSFAAADRYGLPLAPVLERLADEARSQRRRDADALARQLPVRLSIPLAVCTLPSFVLLAIVPLLLGAFSSLRTQ